MQRRSFFGTLAAFALASRFAKQAAKAAEMQPLTATQALADLEAANRAFPLIQARFHHVEMGFKVSKELMEDDLYHTVIKEYRLVKPAE